MPPPEPLAVFSVTLELVKKKLLNLPKPPPMMPQPTAA
jgi:hypothetical protein